MHLRQAPEQIRRGERHSGLIENMIAAATKDHHVIGKDQMKQYARIIKNDSMRKGGDFSRSQWVLATAPSRPGSLGEEDDWRQLGVLASQQDATTEFGFKAQLRTSMQKEFVRMDCGRRYAAAMLRKAKPVDNRWSVGDFAMYQIRQNARAPGEEWSGPARVVGFASDVGRLQHTELSQ